MILVGSLHLVQNDLGGDIRRTCRRGSSFGIMAEGYLGASASTAGDDFHELWALRHIFELLKLGTAVRSVKVEGVPSDDIHDQLGDKAQAVDLTIEREGTADRFTYLQLKFSPSAPKLAWTWSRLLRRKAATKTESSVLGKLAQTLSGVDFAGRFAIVTNQPVADEVRNDVRRLLDNGVRQSDDDAMLLDRLEKACGLSRSELLRFLERWDMDGFESVARLAIETTLLADLAEMIDADARDDMLAIRQRVASLVLPENIHHGPVTRNLLLLWLGAGVEAILQPAPSRLKPTIPYLPRTQTPVLIERILADQEKPVRICADGGCGKTSLIQHLPDSLPDGSEAIIYDCYGGGLFLSSDDPRHLPERAFVQMGNELAFRLGTPFVLRRGASIRPIEAFRRRVGAASDLIAQRSPDALLLLCFDAVDNSRLAARRRGDACFIDDLLAISSWPANVRVVLSCRTSRAEDVGPAARFDDIAVPPFTAAEVEAIIDLRGLAWRPSVARNLHDLSGGNPRRLAYAVEGLGVNDAEIAISRLMPRAAGIDPLFEKRAREAGNRLGGEEAIWALLCILARCPRPIPATILESLADLTAGSLRDVAADLGGIIEHEAGWSFQDEDFEKFADERTQDIAGPLMERAADLLFERRHADRYAAFALGEMLMVTNRMQQLFDLVRAPDLGLSVLTKTEQWLVQARRLVLGLKCCARSDDVAGACDMLLASAEAAKRDTLLAKLLLDNLDLAVRFESETAIRLVLTDRRNRRYRPRFRVHFAAALAVDDAPRAREHLRWWREELRDHLSSDERRSIVARDIAAEFLAHAPLVGIKRAMQLLGGWRPGDIQLDAMEHLLEIGCFEAADILAALSARRLPLVVQAPLAVAALLSGAAVTEPALLEALERLGRAKFTRYPARGDFNIHHSGLFVAQEAALTLCEVAATRGELHASVRGILRNAFPPPPLTVASDLYRLQSAGALHMRVLALWERLEGEEVDLATWLPPERHHPPSAKTARRRFETSPAGKDDIARWNEARRDAIEALVPLLDAARQIGRIGGAEEQEPVFEAIVASLAPAPSYRRDRDPEQKYLVLRAAVVMACCQGSALDPFLGRLWNRVDKLGHGSAYALDLARWLRNVPQQADFLADWLVRLARDCEATPAMASAKAADLMQCSRLALSVDADLARSFFESALAVTEKVDFEALSELRLAMAVVRSGLDGDRSERTALAIRFGNVTGALDESLGLGHDMPYGKAAGTIAAADLPTGLMALSQWHDRGILEPNYGLHELLERDTASALTPAQRIALCIACDMTDAASLDLAGGAGKLEDVAQDWLITQAMTKGDAGQLRQRVDNASALGLETLVVREARSVCDHLSLWSSDVSHTAPERSDAPQAIETKEELERELAALHRQSKVRSHDVSQLASRVHRPTLRVPLLQGLRADDRSARHLANLLVEIVAAWPPYPAVASWIERELPRLIKEQIGELTGLREDDHQLNTLLQLLPLSQAQKAGLALDAIVANAERLGPLEIFSLTGAVAAGERPALRNQLLRSLLARVENKTDRRSTFDLGCTTPPPDPQEAAACFLFAKLGDPDKQVRWRASHAVLLLARCQDPAIAHLVKQLEGDAAEDFVVEPFYRFAASEQLLVVLARAALDTPETLAAFAPPVLDFLRKTTHLMIREHGRAMLLALHGSRAITLDTADLNFVQRLNRPPVLHKNASASIAPGSFFREDKDRPFYFDDTDTIRYWYAEPAGYLGMPMGDFLDEVEAVIHTEWGYSCGVGNWLDEPRSERLSRHERYRSHRHGTHPRVEDLRRYLEWHGMLCAFGRLVETRPVRPIKHFGPNFSQWLDDRLPDVNPYWLSDLRSPAPLVPRFWGHASGQALNYEDRLPGSAFDTELLAADELAIAGDYTWRQGRTSFSVDIRSALVTADTAVSLAHALATATDHMDFILPGGDGDHAIDESGFELKPWLHIRHLEGGFDRQDPYRGAAVGIPVEPMKQVALSADPLGLRYMDGSGRVVVDTRWWGDPEIHGDSHGWRTTAPVTFLRSLLARTAMSMILSVEILPMDDDRRGRKQWRMFVLSGDGTVTRIDPRRRHLGPILLRKAGLTRTVDTFARWILHRIGDLEEQHRSAMGATSAGPQSEIEELCQRFHRHRASQRF